MRGVCEPVHLQLCRLGHRNADGRCGQDTQVARRHLKDAGKSVKDGSGSVLVHVVPSSCTSNPCDDGQEAGARVPAQPCRSCRTSPTSSSLFSWEMEWKP